MAASDVSTLLVLDIDGTVSAQDGIAMARHWGEVFVSPSAETAGHTFCLAPRLGEAISVYLMDGMINTRTMWLTSIDEEDIDEVEDRLGFGRLAIIDTWMSTWDPSSEASIAAKARALKGYLEARLDQFQCVIWIDDDLRPDTGVWPNDASYSPHEAVMSVLPFGDYNVPVILGAPDPACGASLALLSSIEARYIDWWRTHLEE